MEKFKILNEFLNVCCLEEDDYNFIIVALILKFKIYIIHLKYNNAHASCKCKNLSFFFVVNIDLITLDKTQQLK